jgi:Cytochrome c oxidase subunit IV
MPGLGTFPDEKELSPMADTNHTESVGGHGHDEIHLPPNSWVPLATAFGITALFIGFIVGPWLIAAGGLWLIGSLVAWVRAARTEYEELPG